jgi:hypothetical protein
LCTALLSALRHNRTRARVSSFCPRTPPARRWVLGWAIITWPMHRRAQDYGLNVSAVCPFGLRTDCGCVHTGCPRSFGIPLFIPQSHLVTHCLDSSAIVNHSTLPLLRAHIAHIAPARGHSTAPFAISWGRTAGYRTATCWPFFFFFFFFARDSNHTLEFQWCCSL